MSDVFETKETETTETKEPGYLEKIVGDLSLIHI